MNMSENGADKPLAEKRMRSAMSCLAAALLCALLLTACDRYPRDTHGSLEQILERGTVRIGVIEHPPWAALDGAEPDPASGVEVQLISAFARDLGVTPAWQAGTESEHFSALEQHELDVVIGGVDRKNPWRRRLGFTLAYYSEQNDVGAAASEPLLHDLEGVTVTTRVGSGLRKPLADHDATVHSIGELSAAEAPLAAPLWKLRELDLQPNGIELPATKRVMAVPAGENALLLKLEHFLLQHADRTRIEQLLAEQTEP